MKKAEFKVVGTVVVTVKNHESVIVPYFMEKRVETLLNKAVLYGYTVSINYGVIGDKEWLQINLDNDTDEEFNIFDGTFYQWKSMINNAFKVLINYGVIRGLKR